jgi:hypothetical protein
MSVRLVLSSVLAVLAFSALAASAAQAATAEGPFYKITGTRLASGKSQEVKAKMYSHNLYKFYLGDTQVAIGCSSAKFASGAKLLGSTGANSGSGEATLELSGCTTEGSNGAGCKLSSSTIKTVPLKMNPAYLNTKRTGALAVIFESARTNQELFAVTLTGNGGCVDESETPWAVAGRLLGKVEVASKLVEVGKEPAATKVLDVTFPGLNDIEKAWVEKSGALEEKSVGIISDDQSDEYSGTLELEAGAAEWGIFT